MTRDPAAWAWLLYLGVFTIVVAWVLFYSALRGDSGEHRGHRHVGGAGDGDARGRRGPAELLGVLRATGVVMVLGVAAGAPGGHRRTDRQPTVVGTWVAQLIMTQNNLAGGGNVVDFLRP